MTSITQIDVGRDGSWTRIEDGCPSEGGEHSKNGTREIALRDEAEEHNQYRTGINNAVRHKNQIHCKLSAASPTNRPQPKAIIIKVI